MKRWLIGVALVAAPTVALIGALIGALIVALIGAVDASAAPPLTPSEKRGRELYLHGKGTVHPISAFFGADDAGQIDASIVPCASCHGPDGRGIAEGTVAPADIRWSVLAEPFYSNESGRRRPRYDPTLLARAVREAVDASGAPLYAVMPRYHIDDRDLDDLIAYLHRLGDEPQPGLDDDAVNIGTVVPLTGPRAPVGEAMRSVVLGYFEDVNQQGGLFGRRLKLESTDAAASADTIAGALAGPIFGVIGASWSPDDQQIDDFVETERIPLVTPFPTSAESRSAVSSFYLFPDLESQAAALIDFAAERAGGQALRIVLVHDGSKRAEAAATSAERRCAALGWKVVERPSTSDGADILLLIGNVDTGAAVAAVKAKQVLIAGASIPESLFDLKGRQVFVAASSLPSDVTGDGLRELASFIDRHHLDPAHRAAEIATYAAAKVFVEALRRSGREATRERLIASLEHLYGFATEVTPPITYGPSHHVGALGAYIVGIDFDHRTFATPSRWITPAE